MNNEDAVAPPVDRHRVIDVLIEAAAPEKAEVWQDLCDRYSAVQISA
jgi:hypothetical protein